MIGLRRLSLVSALALVPSTALADLPPPDGTKNVGFSFKITGVAAAPDRVVFSYPCSPSNGAPMMELVKVEEGVAIPMGRRGGGCPLYAIAKSDYDAWAKQTPRPTPETLVAKAMKCTGAVTPAFTTSTSDSRNEIQQTLEVTKLDATTCAIGARAIPAATGAASTPTTGGAPLPTTTTSPGASTSGSRCSLARGPSDSALGIGAALVALAAVVRRRRR
jgi:hypothetical protein